jgi:hypothetical protein
VGVSPADHGFRYVALITLELAHSSIHDLLSGFCADDHDRIGHAIEDRLLDCLPCLRCAFILLIIFMPSRD